MSDTSARVRAQPSNESRAARLALAGCLLGAAYVALRLWTTDPGTLPAAQNRSAAQDSPGTPVASAAEAVTTPATPVAATAHGPYGAAQQASLAASIEVVVGRNDTLDRIFRRLALDPTDLARIRNLPGIRQSLDFLKPGDAIQFTHLEGALHSLTRKVSETQTLKVVRELGGFSAQMIDNPVQLRVRTASATIDSSLFQSADSAGISELLAMQLANIFAWDIDFVYDIREGDSFKVVYNQVFQDGHYLRDGDILAAEFVNAGRVYRAVRYDLGGGRFDYYSPQGRPMRKAFLRTPVEFTRISSRFNPHRYHPILNLIRGHMGTDYAAPTGTPVRAASDGRIGFRGRRGGYGNALMVAHSRGVSTLYGHLSRFAKGVSLGSHVRQGQVIGYVGMTGLATGPHLHYEYLVNGVHKDPERVQLAAAEPLDAPALQRFSVAAAPLLALLDAPAAADPALAASTPTVSASATPRTAHLAGN